MILSDRDIRTALQRGDIGLEPFEPAFLQPASIDIRVDHRFRIFSNHRYTCIDPRECQEELTEVITVAEGGVFILHPGEFVLGSTLERVTVGTDHVARLEGKSSLGRLGLLCHATAGWIDPGFTGHITLELSNVANLPIKIYPSMPIGQLSFARLSSPADRPYGSEGTRSKYQGQEGPTESRMWANFTPDSPGEPR
ncbi:MAG: dCTP deaminase [Thermoleophilia bacterium]|nr:dCTP deaminase [Thermoleophilia bacterium]